VPLSVIASVLSVYAFWLYRALYHPVGQQRFTQTAFSGEPSGDKYGGADNAAQDRIPLHEIETEEVQEATDRSRDG
jgi:hypothetical protein